LGAPNLSFLVAVGDIDLLLALAFGASNPRLLVTLSHAPEPPADSQTNADIENSSVFA
jgi:hypothetical protein